MDNEKYKEIMEFIGEERFWEDVDLMASGVDVVVDDVEGIREILNETISATLTYLVTERLSKLFEPLDAVVEVDIYPIEFGILAVQDRYIELIKQQMKERGTIG